MVNDGIDMMIISVITLVVITLSYFDYYFKNIKFSLFYVVAGLGLIYINGYFVYLIPLFIFDTFDKRFYSLNTLAFLLPLIFLDLPSYNLIALISLSASSLIISIFMSNYYEGKKKFINMQDDFFELETKSTTQNKQILEAQDSEVYLAILNERSRISREIHDNVGHILSSSIIQTRSYSKNKF